MKNQVQVSRCDFMYDCYDSFVELIDQPHLTDPT